MDIYLIVIINIPTLDNIIIYAHILICIYEQTRLYTHYTKPTVCVSPAELKSRKRHNLIKKEKKISVKIIMLEKLKRELKNNEENIQATCFLIESEKAKLDLGDWPESVFNSDQQIAFLEDRLIKHTNKRKEILNDIKKL